MWLFYKWFIWCHVELLTWFIYGCSRDSFTWFVWRLQNYGCVIPLFPCDFWGMIHSCLDVILLLDSFSFNDDFFFIFTFFLQTIHLFSFWHFYIHDSLILFFCMSFFFLQMIHSFPHARFYTQCIYFHMILWYMFIYFQSSLIFLNMILLHIIYSFIYYAILLNDSFIFTFDSLTQDSFLFSCVGFFFFF